MKASIVGYGLYHETEWYKTEDKDDKGKPKKNAVAQVSPALYIVERQDDGKPPVLRKVKVNKEQVGDAMDCNESVCEVVVNIVDTNFQGKPGREFQLIQIKSAAA